MDKFNEWPRTIEQFNNPILPIQFPKPNNFLIDQQPMNPVSPNVNMKGWNFQFFKIRFVILSLNLYLDVMVLNDIIEQAAFDHSKTCLNERGNLFCFCSQLIYCMIWRVL